MSPKNERAKHKDTQVLEIQKLMDTLIEKKKSLVLSQTTVEKLMKDFNV